MTNPFEQQLQQLHPVPVTGLEEMLYQAGWQAGHAAALAEQASSAPTGSVNGQAARRSPRLGFFGGAASGLVAASLMFVAAAWSGWLPNSNSAASNRLSVPIARVPEAPARQPEPARRPDTASLAAAEQGRPNAGFNLLAWLDFDAAVSIPAISRTQSQLLTTAPTSGLELDRLLSVSANFSSRKISPPNSEHSSSPTAPEFLRYLPGSNSLPGDRF